MSRQEGHHVTKHIPLHNEQYDSYYCPECFTWLEELPCIGEDKGNCPYCKLGRPDVPPVEN